VKLVEIFQGKWLGHPLHPAIVHLPLGLWIAAGAFDLVLRLGWGNSALVYLALYSVALGLLSVLLVIPSGLADWSSIKPGKPAWKLGLYHLALNGTATVLWSLNLWLRVKSLDDPQPITNPVLILSVAGTLLVIAGGYLGSLMTFDQGISVARLSKKKWREVAIQGGARVPEEK
jgi:uncharacterized membrane protein